MISRCAQIEELMMCLPEGLALWHGKQRQLLTIRGLERHGVAPPSLDGVEANVAVLRVLQAEEDDNDRDGDTRVERGGQNVWNALESARCKARGCTVYSQLYLVHHEK